MTDHKFTDDEVIKALECCTNCICNHAKTDTECPLVKMDFCKNYLMKQSLALISRQKVEIERLNKEVDRLSQCVLYHDGIVSDLERDLFNAKAEAIKEFAERLKAERIKPEFPWDDFFVTESAIDSLVKEMMEDNNESQNT